MATVSEERCNKHVAVTFRVIVRDLFVCGAFNGAAWAAELAPPVALSAAGVMSNGFTASWNTVSGATSYRLDVYRFDGVPPTTECEGFDDYPDVTPEGWLIENKGGSYTVAASCGAAPPSVKLEADGHAITTPLYPAAVTNLSFWCKGNSVSNSLLSVEGYRASEWVTLDTLRLTNSSKIVPFEFNASDAYVRFRLIYDKDKGNVGIDDVNVSYGGGAKTFVLSDIAVVEGSSYAVTNLTPGVYFYVVRATDGTQMSEDSNEIKVDTAVSPVPPLLGAVAPQTVRVGDVLSFELVITATDGDPVTATNATASVGVSGAWGVCGGVFTYAPSAEDLGERMFSFAVQDKDGWSDEVAVTVTVRPARIPAVRMTAATGVYVQTFDTLALSGTNNVWDNAAEPLAGWYAFVKNQEGTSYRTGSGTGTKGGLYSFGTDGSTNRSLGSLASSENTYRYGVAFTNETGLAVTNLSVCVRTGQWRIGASAATNTLSCAYCITNQVLPLHQGVWRRVNALCFDSPWVANETHSAGAVAAAMAQPPLSVILERPVLPEEVVILRWSDTDDAGNDHGFGIDDVEVAWAAGVPAAAIPVGRSGTTQDFDEMGEDGCGELPHLWRIETTDELPRTTGTYAAAVDRVAYVNDKADFSAPGSYSFSSGCVRDQAVGSLTGATRAQSVSVLTKLLNAAGVSVRGWEVRFGVEKYRNGLVAGAVQLVCSTDGATWCGVGAPVIFPADMDTSGFPIAARPCMTAVVERQVNFDAPIAPGGCFYLAWQISVAEGAAAADAQALALDDVQIRPIFARSSVFTVQ